MSTTNPQITALFEAGAHYGYNRSRRHASTKKDIFTTKNHIDIIDLETTLSQIEKAKEFVKALGESKKTILLVGTKAEAKAVIGTTGATYDMPTVTERWIGGLLTNVSEIKKRIARLEDFREKKAKNELSMYTKKERLLIDREVIDMERKFGGTVSMKKMPDALFVIDPKKEHIAVTEAHKMGIPVIALLNTDCDMHAVDYPIVGNDASRTSIEYIVREVMSAY